MEKVRRFRKQIHAGVQQRQDALAIVVQTAQKYRRLFLEHQPLIGRLLRRLRWFLKRMIRMLKFNLLDIYVRTGGDPVALGTYLGWHHAFLGSTLPRLHPYIHFDPQFDDDTFDPEGHIELDMHIRPIVLIVNGMLLLLQLPYISMWRAYKRLSGEFAA